MTAFATAGLDPCVHCGFCLQSCPTYLATDDEADSPRGRIVLMQALAAGHLPASDPSLQRHLDRCLGCRACEPACPSGVEYGHAVEAVRDVLLRSRPLPWATRLLHGVIAAPTLRQAAFGIARLVRPMSSRFAGRSMLGIAWGMLAATKPTAVSLHAEKTGTDASTDPPVPTATVVLFRGCIMDDLFGHVHQATARVLRANGCRVLEVEGQGCCGALHIHAGQHADAVNLARANLRGFADIPAEALIAVNAAGCGAMLKEYGRLFDDEPEEEAARRLGEQARDITEILADLGPRAGAPLDLRVAYDPPCHLLHAQRVADAPEAVLAAVPGIIRVRHDDAVHCCGSAGSYTFAQPDMSAAVLGAKVRALLDAEPDVVVTGNPGCIMQIGAGLRAAGRSIPVIHPVELLDWSYEQAGYYRA